MCVCVFVMMRCSQGNPKCLLTVLIVFSPAHSSIIPPFSSLLFFTSFPIPPLFFLLRHLSFISSLHGRSFDFIFPWHPSFTHLIQYKGIFQGFWSVRDICLSDFLLTNCPFHYWIWWFSVTEPNPAGVPHRTDAVWGKKEKIPEMY